MMVQCKVCKRIRINGRYRMPWPGELAPQVNHTYCPRCARTTLAALQRGELPAHYQRAAREAAS